MASSAAGAAGNTRRQKVAVVWFKVTDLRTHDHEPLNEAHKSGLPVLHLYVLDPRWYKKTPLCGYPRTGPIRARFQLEALADLRERLRTAGHELTVRRGLSTAEVFDELCADFDVAAVYASREVCSEELRVESAVNSVLRKRGAGGLRLFWTFELHHYDDLPEELRLKGSNSYSGYKRAFHGSCKPRRPLPPAPLARTAPGARWVRADELPSNVSDLGLPAAPAPHPSAEIRWVGGETAALARVQDYLFGTDALALDYVGSTNTPRQGNSCIKVNAMSRLSPWLAHGCISPRTLFSEIKRYERERHKSDSTYWLVHEMYWRDFVRFGSFLAGDRIFKIGGLYNRHPDFQWTKDKRLLEPWVDGQTGFPFVDAALREIKATGYSCHVGRETVAWFFICDLGLDWRMGAEWFESVLIDYEPAANWFCWVFVCLIRATGGNGFREIGHPELAPRTRLQTVETVFLAAQHDPDGEYVKRWIPELRHLPDGMAVREPWRATGEPEAAPTSGRRGQGQRDGWAVGPDRIQMARRTLTKGGPSVAVWWSCSRAGSRRAPSDVEGWPRGYPLPMFPPSSFFDIEKVADKARRQQRQKAARVAALRRAMGQTVGFVRSLPKVSEGSREARNGDTSDDSNSSRGGSRGRSRGKGKGDNKSKGKGSGGGKTHQDQTPGKAGGKSKLSRPPVGQSRGESPRPASPFWASRAAVESGPGSGNTDQRKRRWGRASLQDRTADVDDRLAGQ